MNIIYVFLEDWYKYRKNGKIKNTIRFIFIPIFLLLEYLIYIYYWKLTILKDLLTSDAIVDFLDRHDFEYQGNKLKKIDLLSSNEYYDIENLSEANILIKKDYTLAIDNLISIETVFDIENYITIKTETDFKVVKTVDGVFRDRIYTVELFFCRKYFLTKAKIDSVIWLILLGSGITIFQYIINFLDK